jgi:hypothetical protein
VNFYTVFTHPDQKDDPTIPAGGSAGEDGRLSVTSTGGNVNITWTGAGFTLQSAPSLGGAWSNVSASGNAYSTAASGQRLFFRLFK